MPARTSPGQTRSALLVEEPGQANEKWATGTNARSKWSRADNKDLMICYYNSEPAKRGYMKRMLDLWLTKRPNSNLNEKQLVAQKANVIKKKLLSDLEIEELQNAKERNQPDGLEKQDQEDQPNEPTLTESPAAMNEVQTDQLDEETANIKTRIEHTMEKIKENGRKNLPKLKVAKPNQPEVLAKINKALEHIATPDISETNLLMYAAATETLQELGVKTRSGQPQIPAWKNRLQTKIKQTRREISQLSEIERGKTIKDHKRLMKKYGRTPVSESLETQKQKLVALSSRLERYTKDSEFKWINSTFQTDPGKVYTQLKGVENNKQDEPPKQETETFWKNIWENQVTHNTNADWLKDLEQDYSQDQEQENIRITEKDLKERVRKMKSWRAPGPDMVHGYWLKKLTALHQRLATQMNQLIQTGNHPEWLTQGRTSLLMKDPKQGAIPKNYRPITCLPTTWKLFSGIIAQKIQDHMDKYMSQTQKGIGNKSRGTKHQLLIDTAVIKDSKSRQTNLGMAWIDYKKAYDSVPHSWILKCLQIYKINPRLVSFIRRSMNNWKTTLTVNTTEIGQVNIKRGIYQGDALSPLLFCISLNPLSDIIRKSDYGYKFKSGTKINHLFYMDDIKLYAKTERDIDSLIHLTRIFSQDIGMSFGLDKCGRLIVKRGKITKTDGIDLPEGHIDDVEEKYKYLGILQSYGNHEGEIKAKAITEYKKRIRQVLKSQLTAMNKVTAINTYATPVIRYTAGVINWTQEEKSKLDIQTRKLFTMHGAFHPKSNVERLYYPRKQGGRGLISIERTIQEEEESLRKYVAEKAPTDQLISEYAKKEKINEAAQRPTTNWQDKPLHGKYHQSIEKVADLEKTYQWLVKSNLKDNTEALIMAAQEQALKTRAIEAKIHHTRQDPTCRLCHQHDETIQHLTSGCVKLAGTAYTERHNQVALIIYRNICDVYDLETPKNWWEIPAKNVENDKAKILWDFHIQTDKQVKANQPDIVIVDKERKESTIIDIAVPNDINIKEKEHEKIEKYQPLKEELSRIWKVKTKVVPVVVGALGAITPTQEQWLKEIPGQHNSIQLQKSALLGTAKILRRTLKLPGLW